MDARNLIKIVSVFLLILIVGCSSSSHTIESRNSNTVKSSFVFDKSPKDVLLREIADGKLVEVYDEFVRVESGSSEENWIIISNVHEETETFTIRPCNGCKFDKTETTIPSGGYEIIRFYVDARDGRKEIKVVDGRNNAYGFSQISVIVE